MSEWEWQEGRKEGRLDGGQSLITCEVKEGEEDCEGQKAGNGFTRYVS